MAEQTFRINVIVDPANARAGVQSVQGELKKLGNAAAQTQQLLKRALTLIGVEEGIRAIVGLIDAYTKLQNRIRVVVQNNEILGEVTQRVFDIANRSRSSFEGTAELYSRVALATRDLGVSENELLGVTESVNKAIILSGASAKEANNGLIQLSQGLASNRLGGDELRAVLEQLPVVADVIAKQLGLTRGQLRIFSREGNISAKTVIDAFKNAREELEQRFAKTIPTVGQALQLLRNNLVKTFGELGTNAGLTTLLAQSISFLARNLEILIKLLAIFSATLAAVKIAPFIRSALDAAEAIRTLSTAVAAGNAVLLGSAEAARQQAAFEVEGAAARTAKTEATIGAIRSEQALALVSFESTDAARALAVAELEGAAATARRAQVAAEAAASENATLLASEDALTILQVAAAQEGELVLSREALVASTDALTVAQAGLNTTMEAGALAAAAQAASQTQLSALEAELAAETTVLTAAQARLAAAEGAVAAESGVLTGAIGVVRGALTALWATIVANPIGALLVVLAAAGTALFVFRNDIQLSGDGFATLGDFTSAYFDLFKGGLASIRESFGEVFGFIGDTIERIFGEGSATFAGFLRGAAQVTDVLLGLGQGPLLALFTFIVDGFALVFRTVSTQAQKFFDGMLNGLIGLGTAFSAALSGDFSGAASAAKDALNSALSATSIDVGQIAAEFRDLGADVGANFTAGLNSTATLDFVNQLIDDAEAKAKERKEAALRAQGSLNTKGLATSTISPAVVKITRELQDQEHLLSLINKTNTERKVESDLLHIKNELITQGAAQASQQLGQVDQQITQLRQKATADGADVKGIQLQITKLQSLRQQVIERTKSDRSEFDGILDGLRVQLLYNDSLQAQLDVMTDLRGQQEQFTRTVDAADEAERRGLITSDERDKVLRKAAEAARTTIDQGFHDLELQNALLSVTRDTNVEREVAIALAQKLQELAAQGEKLDASQEGKLSGLIAQNQALQRQQDLIQDIPLTQAKADEALAQKINDLDAAYARGAISLEQYVIGLERANQSTLTLVQQGQQELQNQNALLSVVGRTTAERELGVAVLQAEQTLRAQGVTLSAAEKERLIQLTAENQALQRQASLIQSITPTASKIQQQYAQDLVDVSAAFKRGAIDADTYAQGLEDITLKAAEAGHTLEDGFTRASIKIQDSIRDMATVTEQSLVSAFNSAEQAINDFALNGTVNVRALAQSLVADFTKVISHLLILQATEGLGLVKPKAGTGLDAGAATLSTASAALAAPAGVLDAAANTLLAAIPGLNAAALALQTAALSMQAAGAAGGAAGLGFNGLGGGGFGIDPLTPFAASGADALANQPFIVGEQGMELFVPKTAGTIVPHAETVSALAGASAASAGRTVVNSPRPEVHVHITNTIDPRDVVEAGLNSREGQTHLVNAIGKNKTSVKKTLS